MMNESENKLMVKIDLIIIAVTIIGVFVTYGLL